MSTQFDSNTFEHDFIVATLLHFIEEIKTDRPIAQVVDKYAVQLTAFMNCQALKAHDA